jgi:ABC-type phosphonate transport system ATPase subunit
MRAAQLAKAKPDPAKAMYVASVADRRRVGSAGVAALAGAVRAGPRDGVRARSSAGAGSGDGDAAQLGT